jgi:hypothetical protein
MGFLSNLFGKKQSTETAVEYDDKGKVLKINVSPGKWAEKRNGQNKYYTQNATSLLEATEILKRISSIPQFTYYLVITPDGSLGRDIQGYYTEAPIKTKKIVVSSPRSTSEAVECGSLMGFGDIMANQTTIAHLKSTGNYAQLILQMECGHCGYESPVETQPGSFTRECYCCGAENKVQRGNVNVFMGSRMVEI